MGFVSRSGDPARLEADATKKRSKADGCFQQPTRCYAHGTMALCDRPENEGLAALMSPLQWMCRQSGRDSSGV